MDDEAILNGPAIPPPDGVEPNFDNPPNRNALGYGLITTMLALATLTICCRLLARVFKTKTLRAEDCIGIIAYLFFLAWNTCGYVILQSPGFYVHEWNVRAWDLERILNTFGIAMNFYSGAIGSVKAAIILEWLRIFSPPGTRDVFFWACHIILWANVLFYLQCFVSLNIYCKSDSIDNDGHCVGPNTLYLAVSIINLGSDVAILLLPQVKIWSLNMTRQRKWGVSSVFLIGLLCCAIAATRLATSAVGPQIPDYVYRLPLLFFLGTSEMLCGLLVLCVPSFPQAFKILGSTRLVSRVSKLVSSRNSSPQALGRSSKSWHRKSIFARPQDRFYEIESHSLEEWAVPGSVHSERETRL
ncbi:hypothetical protein GGR52DRAFT_589026, partial [Hypoxylon sp. FL1284]